jgi:hypothetical protein
MQYQVGQQLELEVRGGIQYNSMGVKYITVVDEFREYRIFDIIKCQEEGPLPPRLYVLVKSVDAFGHAKIIQDTQRVYVEHYVKDEEFEFVVDSIKLDNNNNPYYALSDDFSEQRFYIRGEQKYGVGDTIRLRSLGQNARGFMQYKEVEPKAKEPVIKDVVRQTNATVVRTNTVNYGPESTTVEYKSSLVFDAATSEPNLEKQSRLIITEIAAMMNTDGGKLVIGVRDDQTVIGIQDEYKYLNDDETDNWTYKLDEDGYKQKILHKLNYLCSALAGMSVRIEFKEKVGNRYCVIDIDRTERPVWVGSNQEIPALYIRQDSRRKQLKGDEITEYIYRRMKKATEDVVGGAQALATLDETAINEIVRRIINANKKEVILPPVPKREVDWWIVWKNDGVWYRQRNESTDADVAIQVPLYKNMSTPVVLFCYDNTNVVAREYKVMNRGTNANQPNKSVWTPGLTPRNIFIIEPTDFLCIHSLDYNGVESIKLHAVTDFATVASATAAGNPILPAGSQVQQYGIIGAENRVRLQHLIVPKVRRSQEAGIPLSTQAQQIADEVAHALELLKR